MEDRIQNQATGGSETKTANWPLTYHQKGIQVPSHLEPLRTSKLKHGPKRLYTWSQASVRMPDGIHMFSQLAPT